MKALAPATVREVRIHPDTGIAEVIVPDFQLSLAIGKEGQNARLAARLTGWRVDIKSETPARGGRVRRRRRVRRGRVGREPVGRARVAARRRWRGDLRGRGRLRVAGPRRRDRRQADAATPSRRWTRPASATSPPPTDAAAPEAARPPPPRPSEHRRAETERAAERVRSRRRQHQPDADGAPSATRGDGETVS